MTRAWRLGIKLLPPFNEGALATPGEKAKGPIVSTRTAFNTTSALQAVLFSAATQQPVKAANVLKAAKAARVGTIRHLAFSPGMAI